MQRAFGAVKCKTKDCENFIPRKYLGIYDPDRITIPECEEEEFTEFCGVCREEHQYKMEDALVVLIEIIPPLKA
jgi:hypothetical protein